MRSGRLILLVVALLLGVVGILLVASLGEGDERVLHSRGNGPLGAKGLVLLLDELAEVEVVDEVPAIGEVDTAVVLADFMNDGERNALSRWVAAGGTLLVADPFSPLQPTFPTLSDIPGFDDNAEQVTGQVPRRDRGSCAEPAFDDVEGLAALDGNYLPGELVSCFARGVVVESVGDGTVVGLASPWPLVNAYLDDDDNAVLAAVVLAPTPETRVAFVQIAGSPIDIGGGGGDGGNEGAVEDGPSLSSLISDPVWLLFAQLGIAAVLVVWWQARRLGRPVVETTPVALDGADLTKAVGNFLERANDAQHGGALLRREGRRALGRRLGLGADVPLRMLAESVAARTGRSVNEVEALLVERPFTTNDDLVQLANQLDELVDAVDHPGGTR
jgi:hypothetical protein